MAADMHIHAFLEGQIIEEDFRCFFGNHLGHRMSSYYTIPEDIREKAKDDPESLTPGERALVAERFFSQGPCGDKYDCSHWKKISDSENIWVGEVSWLKAALFEDGDENFVPDAIGKISELVDGQEEWPRIVTEELIDEIEMALAAENRTGYSTEDEEGGVIPWLRERIGHRIFTVSW